MLLRKKRRKALFRDTKRLLMRKQGRTTPAEANGLNQNNTMGGTGEEAPDRAAPHRQRWRGEGRR